MQSYWINCLKESVGNFFKKTLISWNTFADPLIWLLWTVFVVIRMPTLVIFIELSKCLRDLTFPNWRMKRKKKNEKLGTYLKNISLFHRLLKKKSFRLKSSELYSENCCSKSEKSSRNDWHMLSTDKSNLETIFLNQIKIEKYFRNFNLAHYLRRIQKWGHADGRPPNDKVNFFFFPSRDKLKNYNLLIDSKLWKVFFFGMY